MIHYVFLYENVINRVERSKPTYASNRNAQSTELEGIAEKKAAYRERRSTSWQNVAYQGIRKTTFQNRRLYQLRQQPKDAARIRRRTEPRTPYPHARSGKQR